MLMTNQHLREWTRILSREMPHLSKPQLQGLATWSFGMVISRSSSLSRVAYFISQLNGESENTAKKRLKEWYCEPAAKKGEKRAELEVTNCFPCLLKWVISLFPETCHQLPLALDATTVGQNFTALSINVLYRSCAIPVAWKIVKATEKESWKPLWLNLLDSLKSVVPPQFQVIVCADRGLYAPWLYQKIVSMDWHPFLRINQTGTYQPDGEFLWHSLRDVVKNPGEQWSGKVTCFRTNPLDCTMLARWDEGYKEPWLIVTDLDSQGESALWYGLRPWIECSYRDFKSDGWQWHKSRMSDPNRAERLWLAMAVATLWMVTLGGEDEGTQPEFCPDLIPVEPSAKSAQVGQHHSRHLSCFLKGLLSIIADLLNGQPIFLTRWNPEPWPGSGSGSLLNTS